VNALVNRVKRRMCMRSERFEPRELKKLSHDVRLMPAKNVKVYVKRNKNDAVDGEYCAGEDGRAASTAHAAPLRPTRPPTRTGQILARDDAGGD
jgi:hypothetical protein